ncbi:MAG: hypothetical protein E7L01_12675 [Paenibacillus macerans]|uniref:Uncharacterized protein n=1 Tax=Paenibacillus macerans TaxID=44252 RepID=A0A6N8EV39_PAEMA|nr:hypothetical protein [Paenibacillus macerans]MCY7560359.1 hypothetical protein [Paenibacillus macerans]MDU7474170.1 hypothetical protein [Paenibacillus macerans]MEC0154725.1 hypothetical protein [Paenibacillus macerans]MEC0331483.1 hypothetical protein [Paenibacillus macerans]MUG22610.1 hypothetical protein [Paenibacillus macerans]
MGNEAASKMPERLLGAAFFLRRPVCQIIQHKPVDGTNICSYYEYNKNKRSCWKMHEGVRGAADGSGHRGALFVPGDTCEFSMLRGMVKAEIRQRLYSYLGN